MATKKKSATKTISIINKDIKSVLKLFPFVLLLAACYQTPSTFPLSADGLFTGSARDFLLNAEIIGRSYTSISGADEYSNADVEGRSLCFSYNGCGERSDGAAYIEATGRLNAWSIRFDSPDSAAITMRENSGEYTPNTPTDGTGEDGAATIGPAYFTNTVTVFDNLEGPHLALGRQWNTYWNGISNGEYTQLPAFPELNAEQLITVYDLNGYMTVDNCLP